MQAMTPTRPLLTALTMSLFAGLACTPSSSAGRQPTTTPGDSSPEKVAAETQRTPEDDGEELGSPVVAAVAPPSAPPVMVRPVVVPRPSGPYGVKVVDEGSRNLPTYNKDGRTYVMGTIGSRYSIVLTNPTYQRVEAVVSVDGLDAMDGQPANYAVKRGYILPPFGNATIDGFRTSFDQVATFRFSSVADSYAGRLGQARDVGVIGVAFFPERPPPAPVARVAPPPSADDVAPNRHAPAGPSPVRSAHSSSSGDLYPPSPSPASASGARKAAPSVAQPEETARRGLGTEFGEARDSHIGSTQFERANTTTPSQVVAVRYNDRAGLVALGIRIAPLYPSADLTLRETAEPFRTNGFAQPPP